MSSPSTLAFTLPLSPTNSNTSFIVSVISKFVALCGTVVSTLYVNSSSNFCKSTCCLSFTFLVISGFDGGGVTVTGGVSNSFGSPVALALL